MSDKRIIQVVLICCVVSIVCIWGIMHNRNKYQKVTCGAITLTIKVDKKYPHDMVCQAIINKMQEDKK